MAVAGDLGKVHHGFSDHLVAPFLRLVQYLILRLVQRQFRPYCGGVRGVAACYTVALYHILRIVFPADGDGPVLAFKGDIHAEDSRHVVHVEHLEPVISCFLRLWSRVSLALRNRISST